MKAAWPEFESRIVRGALISRGELRPTPVNGIYRVRVELAPGSFPKAFVEAPQLRAREQGGKIPHTYDNELPCLFYPRAREWGDHMRVADTILPWLMEWLFHYEAWLATGWWSGGGMHVGSKDHGAAA